MSDGNIGQHGRPRGLGARAVVALTVSALVGLLAIGAPAQASAPERGSAANYTCLWYTVRAGDTLNAIAQRYGVTVIELRRVNGLRDTRIYVGQRLCVPRPVSAPPSQPAGPWRAEYWNNTIQSGPPALTRNESAINFDWGFGSPDLQRVQPDFFSARWTRTFNLSAGVWRFAVQADDGIRVFINDQAIIDAYDFVGLQTPSVDVPLNQGRYTVRVDYVEQTQRALARLTITRVSNLPQPTAPPPPPAGGGFNNGPWQVDFFPNPNLAGPPAVSRVVCCLQFDWRGAPPVAGVPATFFSARFSQVRYFPAGVYQFVVRADDGVRLFLDGQLLINEFREQSARTFVANANLGAGNHSLIVEYVQYGGQSNLSLYWDFLGDPGGPRASALSSPPPFFPPLP